MLKIAICDDSAQELERTYSIVMDFIRANPETDFSVQRFQSACDLLYCIDMSQRFDIYLLDIIMPVLSGIDIGTGIRETDENAIIIYLTNSTEYAIRSYKVFAFQYLVKPVASDELHAALAKAVAKIDIRRAKSIPVKTKDGITAILHHKIVYLEYLKHSLLFHLNDGSVVQSVISREPFDATASELLKDGRFIRPHVSFVVNMSNIRSITGSSFMLTDGSQVPISRSNFAAAKKSYIDYLLKGDESN